MDHLRAETSDPDECRPVKRARLDGPLQVTEDLQEEMDDEDGWDDIYGEPDGFGESKPADLIAHSSTVAASGHLSPAGSDDIAAAESQPENDVENKEPDGLSDEVPADAVNGEDDLVTQEKRAIAADEASEGPGDETAQVEAEPPIKVESEGEEQLSLGQGQGHEGSTGNLGMTEEIRKEILPTAIKETPAESPASIGEVANVKSEPAEDPKFLEAATEQKGNPEAEWQFNSSDAESSSDSDSDSDSEHSSDEASDSGSEGGYEMLDPATAAKILMYGDGDDGDGEKRDKNGGDHQPRTANEKKYEAIPKPDVVVTEDMKITFLGTVDHSVDNQVLVKADTPGEYQVLEAGSVLCKEDREVIGAVAETLGRVQEPVYSVAFNTVQELQDAGLEYGTKVFYVDSHSTFVFTQSLKNLKGTDASNLHDEEVTDGELEFSDDEKEAEYKRQKKAAKRGGRGRPHQFTFDAGEPGAKSFGAPGHDSRYIFLEGSDAPQQQYGGGMSYDEGDVQDDFYSPLKRPDNLSELMAGGVPPRPQRHLDRGRGRGRGDSKGRGRGDRGRGRGGFDHRNLRGGRGGRVQDGGRGSHGQPAAHRGSAHSFPDRHNNERTNGHGQHSDPPRPAHSSSPPQQYRQDAPPSSYQHSQQQPHAPQPYQFNGYAFQYGNAPPQQPAQQTAYYNPMQPVQSQHPILGGPHVNSTSFQNQQQQQQQQLQPQPQSQQSQWPQQYHGATLQQYQAMYSAIQQQQQQGRQQQQSLHPSPVAPSHGGVQQPAQQSSQQYNLADILRQFSGEQK